MKIVYLGQRGIPVLERNLASNSRERRVEALAQEMAGRGHNVTVTCAAPFASKNIKNFNGVSLSHVFSLHPEKSGGWVHSVLSALSTVYSRPDVIHIQGWKMAVLVKIIKMINSEAVIVWTVDCIPNIGARWAKFVARQAESVCDGVSVSTRQLQYLMLNLYGIKARYIPDGYSDNKYLTEMPLKHYGVRKGQYLVCLASKPKDVSFVARAYEKSGSKKKVVALADKKGYMVRLAKKYSFLRFVGEITDRPAESLIKGAAAVIVSSSGESVSTILKAMKNGRATVAITDPLYEETLGTAAQYVKDGDVDALSRILKAIVKDIRQQKLWGQKAKKRAQRYYQWPDLADQYYKLYRYPLTRSVAVDSVIRPRFVASNNQHGF